MIPSYIISDLKKLSYIKDVKLENGYIFLFYSKDDKMLKKKVPYRATRDMLLKKLEAIQDEIGYMEMKEKYYKDKLKEAPVSGFAYTGEK